VGQLNLMLRGWAKLLLSRDCGPSYEIVNETCTRRLRRWLCTKHKVRVGQYTRFPNEYLHQQLGLIQLRGRDRLAMGDGLMSCPRAGCGKFARPVR